MTTDNIRIGSGSITGGIRRTGFRFKSRTVTEDGVEGVRVWRVE